MKFFSNEKLVHDFKILIDILIIIIYFCTVSTLLYLFHYRMEHQNFNAQELINFILLKYNDVLDTTIHKDDIKLINFYINIHGFTTLMSAYGYRFLLAVLKYFEFIEDYEVCKIIINQINIHNIQTQDCIPTNL